MADRLQNIEISIFTEDSLTLVHGGYHPGNIFFQSNNEGRFAVYDWAAVHNGCAGEDLGRIIFFGLTPELGELYRYSRSPSSFVKHKRINKNANQDDASA